jgi:hypothetical protein
MDLWNVKLLERGKPNTVLYFQIGGRHTNSATVQALWNIMFKTKRLVTKSGLLSDLTK